VIESDEVGSIMLSMMAWHEKLDLVIWLLGGEDEEEEAEA
jgi:hypothetical protein